MPKDLTNSNIDRQNILNNQYALSEIQKAIGIEGFKFEGKVCFTKKQVADFFEIDERTVERYLEKNDSELRKNGYEILTGVRLSEAKKVLLSDIHVGQLNFPNLGIFDFRAFLNISMLLVESQKAREIRSVILDVVIDTINQKSGGHTKFINQREENFLMSSYEEENYRKIFTNALDNYVNMGPVKYAIYTNKVYQIAFRENAKEYKEVLGLGNKENMRDTLYSEILDIISALENGIANELENEYKKLKRKLTPKETDELFIDVDRNSFMKPIINKARNLMASRDLCFRDALHQNLEEYITDVSKTDFEKFLGEKSKALGERLEETKDVFIRLKDR
ncbi:MAG: DNA-binding protein [Candidatus Altimarinota bacterium]